MSFHINRLHVAIGLAVAVGAGGALGPTAALGGALTGGSDAQAESTGALLDGAWVEKWSEDLRLAQATVEERHPSPFRALDRSAWEREFETLIARLATLQHHEVAVELARIIARLQDGHTRLTLPLGPGIDFMQGHSKTPAPHVAELRFHDYPVRFAIDADGVYVRRIGTKHRAALGGRVVRLGRLQIQDALDAVAPTIRRDNDLQLRHHLPMHLVLAEILHARGVTDTMTELAIEVRLPDGTEQRMSLPIVSHTDVVEWVDARDGDASSPPLYLQHPERRFWFTHLPDHRAMYLQFNEVYNEEHESLRDFAARVESFLRDEDVEYLIVDLRHNRGGNMALARPLLHAIVRSDINRTGRFFTLIGRTTFSAAMNFALSLEKHTNVLYVGEPTGSTPNHYGDSRKTRLPNSGLTLRVSTLYHQYDPTDARTALPPHIPVDLGADDYRNNRDPGVDTILEIIAARASTRTSRTDAAATRERGTASCYGFWRGYTSPGLNSFELTLAVESSASGPRVRTQIPALELDVTGPSNVSLNGDTLGFEIEWSGRRIHFEGTAAGDWFIGEGLIGDTYFPFVMRRQGH